MKRKNKSILRITLCQHSSTLNQPSLFCFSFCFYQENNRGKSVFLCIFLRNKIPFEWSTAMRYPRVILPTCAREKLSIAFDTTNGYLKNSRCILYHQKTKCTSAICFISRLHRFSQPDYLEGLNYFTILNYISVSQKTRIILRYNTDIYLLSNRHRLPLNKMICFILLS